MKVKFFVLSLFVAVLSAPVLADPLGKSCTPFTPGVGYGYEIIEAGHFYVVHSAVYDTSSNRIQEVSNIFVIKGNTDSTSSKTTVWLYGSGYGNDDEDLKTYLGIRGDTTWTARRSAMDDATDVNCVIENEIGINASQVVLRFIAPHKHIDHINPEFLSAMFGTGESGYGYPLNGTRHHIHQADYYNGAILACTQACCGDAVCTQASPYFGVAYTPAWSSEIKRRFSTLSSLDNLACDVVGKISTPRGTWDIVLSPGHTDGAVNLSHANYYLHSSPKKSQVENCSIPATAVQYEVHGYGTVN